MTTQKETRYLTKRLEALQGSLERHYDCTAAFANGYIATIIEELNETATEPGPPVKPCCFDRSTLL